MPGFALYGKLELLEALSVHIKWQRIGKWAGMMNL
jgi:hypothetical protein